MNYKDSKLSMEYSSKDFMDLKSYKVHIFIINFNLADKTIMCLQKLEKQTFQNFYIHLLDNNSHDVNQRELLIDFCKKAENINFYTSDQNSGFALGHNLMFRMVLPYLSEDHVVVLLNNDAFPTSDFIEKIINPISEKENIEMVASRMMQYDFPDKVDNLGNVFYKSGLTSNRLKNKAKLLCPCGGASAFTVRLLKHLEKAHEEIFDEDFFCYVEDTDLGFRALGLGYQCAYASEAVTFHIGSASSGGKFSRFVMIHGLRNSLYFLIKSVPAKIILLNFHWILLLQTAIVFRYLMMGCWKELWIIYSSFFKNIFLFYNKRKRILTSYNNKHLMMHISNQFYDDDYVRNILMNSWWFPFKSLLKKRDS